MSKQNDRLIWDELARLHGQLHSLEALFLSHLKRCHVNFPPCAVKKGKKCNQK